VATPITSKTDILQSKKKKLIKFYYSAFLFYQNKYVLKKQFAEQYLHLIGHWVIIFYLNSPVRAFHSLKIHSLKANSLVDNNSFITNNCLVLVTNNSLASYQ